jgi:alpha-beta hydrolase superfamily lysophospholipase
MSVESVSSEFHLINDGGFNRKVAYSRLGEFNSKHIFLCLPGLLETRESFHPLLEMVEQFDDCCWISIDYCGRGNSDQLPTSEQYAFSKYLADTQDLIETLIQSKKLNPNRKLHLIGTSMGGILAMHLVNRLNHKVDSVVLNDIGFYLHWSALMSLWPQLSLLGVRDEGAPRFMVSMRGRAFCSGSPKLKPIRLRRSLLARF